MALMPPDWFVMSRGPFPTWLGRGVAILALLAALPSAAREQPGLAIWCEFMPYCEVRSTLPELARFRYDLLLHVGPADVGRDDLADLLRAADQQGVKVFAWFLLPYDEHLYVGEETIATVRQLARRFLAWSDEAHLVVRGVVFDCEPSPLLGRELFAEARRGRVLGLARVLRRERNAGRFARSIRDLSGLVRELQGRGVYVIGAGNRVFLDFLQRGNVTVQDTLNAPFSMIPWDRISYITYRYHATQPQYVTMVNRYARLARRFHGPRAALDLGLLGDQRHFPEHRERAELFGGGDHFMAFLKGITSTRDLREVVGVAVSQDLEFIHLYSLEGAVDSVAGLEHWLRAASEARPATWGERWTPVGSLRAALLGATLNGLFKVLVGVEPERPASAEAGRLPAPAQEP